MFYVQEHVYWYYAACLTLYVHLHITAGNTCTFIVCHYSISGPTQPHALYPEPQHAQGHHYSGHTFANNVQIMPTLLTNISFYYFVCIMYLTHSLNFRISLEVR